MHNPVFYKAVLTQRDQSGWPSFVLLRVGCFFFLEVTIQTLNHARLSKLSCSCSDHESLQRAGGKIREPCVALYSVQLAGLQIMLLQQR